MATKIPVTTVNGLYKLTAVNALEGSEASEFAAELSSADDRCFFIVDNAAGDTAVTVSLTPGAYSGGEVRTLGKVEAGDTALLYVDSAFCKTADGLGLTVSPSGAGTKLSAVQFLPVVNN